MRTRILATVVLACALFGFGVPAFAYECEESPKTYKQHPFFFDMTEFGLAQKYGNEAMDRLESHEAWIQAKTFEAPSALTGPSGWFGEVFDLPALCDWWPQNLAIPIGIAYQAFFGNLTIGGNYNAIVNVHDYSANIAFRWYIPGELLGDSSSLAFFGLEDAHWSWHPGQDIKEKGKEDISVEDYAKVNGLDTTRVFVTDVFSLQWAHYFRRNPTVPIEYRIGYNLFQAAFSDFFEEERHHDYPYQWFFEGQIAYEPTAYVSLPITAFLETNGRETPQLYELALVTRSSKTSTGGWKFFYRIPNGIDDNTFVSTRWGLWSASPMIGFGWTSLPGGW